MNLFFRGRRRHPRLRACHNGLAGGCEGCATPAQGVRLVGRTTVPTSPRASGARRQPHGAHRTGPAKILIHATASDTSSSRPPSPSPWSGTTAATTTQVRRGRSGTGPDRRVARPSLGRRARTDPRLHADGPDLSAPGRRRSVRVLLYEDLERDSGTYVAEVSTVRRRRRRMGRTAPLQEGSSTRPRNELVESVRRAREQPLGFLRTKLKVAVELEELVREEIHPAGELPPWTVSSPARRRADAGQRDRRLRDKLDVRPRRLRLLRSDFFFKKNFTGLSDTSPGRYSVSLLHRIRWVWRRAWDSFIFREAPGPQR